MTKVNDYLWQLPHEPAFDDPPDISALISAFNAPVLALIEGPLADRGYQLSASDIIVPPDSEVHLFAEMGKLYRANLRFVRYLSPEIMLRVHFETMPWSVGLPTATRVSYVINLDRFKLSNLQTRQPESGWPGRLHTRVSSRPDAALHHEGDDQVWNFSHSAELQSQLHLFLFKFSQYGDAYLSDPSTM